MKEITLADLQESVQDRTAFDKLDDYVLICREFLAFVERTSPTRIVSPSHPNYIFYQYDEDYEHKITRPLNRDLFIELPKDFKIAFERFASFLDDLKQYQESTFDRKRNKKYLASKEINKVVYTIQQSVGSIGDSFANSNQSRKRVGQLFENLVKLIIQSVGLECEPRTINIPIPGSAGYTMSYELDLVFSRNKAIITSETKFIYCARDKMKVFPQMQNIFGVRRNRRRFGFDSGLSRMKSGVRAAALQIKSPGGELDEKFQSMPRRVYIPQKLLARSKQRAKTG